VISSNGKKDKGNQKPVKLNGKKINAYSIQHDVIIKGGELEFDGK
jgi:putative alpha-1,2-mannosidase